MIKRKEDKKRVKRTRVQLILKNLSRTKLLNIQERIFFLPAIKKKKKSFVFKLQKKRTKKEEREKERRERDRERKEIIESVCFYTYKSFAFAL